MGIYWNRKPWFSCFSRCAERKGSGRCDISGIHIERDARSRSNEYTSSSSVQTASMHKLEVYSAMIRSKLMYWLEAPIMNKSVLNRVEAFQIKVPRKILKMQHAYYNRAHTDLYVFKYAAALLGSLDDPVTKPLSLYHLKQSVKLRAHQPHQASTQILCGHMITARRGPGRG